MFLHGQPGRRQGQGGVWVGDEEIKLGGVQKYCPIRKREKSRCTLKVHPAKQNEIDDKLERHHVQSNDEWIQVYS